MSLAAVQEQDKGGRVKKFLTYETHSYCCAFCGRASNNPREIFADGACKHCGGPGKTFEKITTLETIPDTQKKTLLVYGNDTRKEAVQLGAEIEKRGIQVIAFENLVPNGASRDQKYSLVGQAARAFGTVLLFPSPELNMREGKLAREAYHEANDYLPEGQIKAIPILVNGESAQALPWEARGLYAIALSEDAKQAASSEGVWCGAKDKLHAWLDIFKKNNGM